MLARARALARPASLRHCSVSRAAPAATIWSEPPKPPAGTLEKLADAVRLVALKGACAAPLVSLASMASASSGGGAEGIGDAMTGLAMLGATAVAGGAALALAPEAAAPDVASPLGEQLADLGPVLGTAAALAPGGLHESNSLDIPYFVTSGRQYSLKRKLDRFYGKGDFDYNEELAKNVKDAYPLCKDLLGYLTFNPVMSVAKNIYNITDPAHSHLGAGSRSSAFNSMRCNHHIARGAANEAELFQEAAKVNRLFTEIKALGGFDDYQASVEFVLLACSMYMVHGSGDAHAKIMSAVPLNARCQYAFYNGKVRNDELISDKGVIVDFLEERGRAISDVVQREFRKRTADDQKVKVLAFAQTGAEQLPLGHADYDKRCVGRVNATVAEVDGATLRIGGKNAGRFADHAFHAWYLLTLTLHLGLSLPTDAEPLKVAQWWWHSASSTCLHSTPSTRRLLLLDGVDIDAGGRRVHGRFPHRWGNNFHFALGEHLLGKGRYKSQEPTKPKPEPNPPLPPKPDPDDDDEDDRYAVWMGCTICYIFLTDPLYDQLSAYLLPPHGSLDLNKPEVGKLVYKAYQECEVVGDDEFLKAYFKGPNGKNGLGGFLCPKTWPDGLE